MYHTQEISFNSIGEAGMSASEPLICKTEKKSSSVKKKFILFGKRRSKKKTLPRDKIKSGKEKIETKESISLTSDMILWPYYPPYFSVYETYGTCDGAVLYRSLRIEIHAIIKNMQNLFALCKSKKIRSLSDTPSDTMESQEKIIISFRSDILKHLMRSLYNFTSHTPSITYLFNMLACIVCLYRQKNNISTTNTNCLMAILTAYHHHLCEKLSGGILDKLGLPESKIRKKIKEKYPDLIREDKNLYESISCDVLRKTDIFSLDDFSLSYKTHDRFIKNLNEIAWGNSDLSPLYLTDSAQLLITIMQLSSLLDKSDHFKRACELLNIRTKIYQCYLNHRYIAKSSPQKKLQKNKYFKLRKKETALSIPIKDAPYIIPEAGVEIYRIWKSRKIFKTRGDKTESLTSIIS